MKEELDIYNLLYKSKMGAFCVYSAIYKGCPCYCIENAKTSEKVIFDGGKRIFQSVIKKMERQRLVRDCKKSGSGFMFKFNGNAGADGISLRSFLWGRYNRLPLPSLKRIKIELYDKSAYVDRIIDMRQCNLHDAGGIVTDGISIEVDYFTGKEFIVLQDGERIEFLDYSPEIYRILTTRNLSNFQKSLGNGRLAVTVHFANKADGYAIKNLSRFVAVYNQNFEKFKKQSGSIKRFIHNYPRLDPGKKIEVGHINSCNWNNCAENLMLMSKEQNILMSDIARRLSGRYRIFPIIYRNEGTVNILVEWAVGDASKYIVCKTVDDYIDMLLFSTKQTGMTQNLKLLSGNWDGEKMCTQDVSTPKDCESPRGDMPILDYRETVLDMLNWNAHKNAVVGLYEENPEYFWIWKKAEKGIGSEDLLRQALMIFT